MSNQEKRGDVLKVMKSYLKNEITIYQACTVIMTSALVTSRLIFLSFQLVNILDELLDIDLQSLVRLASSSMHQQQPDETQQCMQREDQPPMSQEDTPPTTWDSDIPLQSVPSPTQLSEASSSYVTALEISPGLSATNSVLDFGDQETLDFEPLTRKRARSRSDVDEDDFSNKRRSVFEEDDVETRQVLDRLSERFVTEHQHAVALNENHDIGPIVSFEDAEIFRRIGDHLGNKPAYNQVLKIMNLYTCGIIDQQVLVNLLKDHIGDNPTLMEWLKKKTGYSEPLTTIVASLLFANLTLMSVLRFQIVLVIAKYRRRCEYDLGWTSQNYACLPRFYLLAARSTLFRTGKLVQRGLKR